MLLFHRGLVAQNLVPNPSFEDAVGCPTTGGQVYLANHWYVAEQTPDYFNACCTLPALGVPSNVFGTRNAATGVAYIGLFTYSTIMPVDTPPPHYREKIGVALESPLIIGTKYYCSFKVSATSSHVQFVNGASNRTGILFSTVQYTTEDFTTAFNHCQISSDEIVSDTTGWVKVQGSFVADSAYGFLSLGNFFDNSNTDTVRFWFGNGGNHVQAYQFIDDVCVSADSLTRDVAVSVSHQPVSAAFVYPNPASGVLYVQSPGKTVYAIVDVLGRKAMEGFFENSAQIDVAPLPAGIYIVSFTSGNKTVRYKQLISR